MCLQNSFQRLFGISNFLPSLHILQRLYPLRHGQFSKSSHLSNIRCFLEQIFPFNDSMLVESFSACLQNVPFLTYTAIAFGSWQILSIFKIVSFFEYQLFFRADFKSQQLICASRIDLQTYISQILGVFQSGFLVPTVILCLWNRVFGLFLAFF